VDGKITLKQILQKWGVRVRNGLNWLRIGPLVGSCEHSNESMGCIKGRKFLDQPSDFEIIMKDSAAFS
jgi:hypothetical protein